MTRSIHQQDLIARTELTVVTMLFRGHTACAPRALRRSTHRIQLPHAQSGETPEWCVTAQLKPALDFLLLPCHSRLLRRFPVGDALVARYSDRQSQSRQRPQILRLATTQVSGEIAFISGATTRTRRVIAPGCREESWSKPEGDRLERRCSIASVPSDAGPRNQAFLLYLGCLDRVLRALLALP
jgi:hypothetical protein